ncbi:MAG: hypothetical protein Q4B91_03435 [Atopobiaceae bacterium]|nr:hypothetical protein [Atopobiaceae bacterium]
MGGRRGARPEMYVCAACGYGYVVWRVRSQLRRRGHGKTMWCPVCGRRRTFKKRGR